MAPVTNVVASVFDDLVLEPIHSETPSALSSLNELFGQSLQPQWQRVGDEKKGPNQLPAPLTKWMQRRENWVKTTKECYDLLNETIEYYREAILVMSEKRLPDQAQRQGLQEVWALISSQVPLDYFVYALTQVIVWVGTIQMEIVQPGEYEDLPVDEDTTLQTLKALLTGLQLMGLGRDRTAIAYAKATDALLDLYARRYRPIPLMGSEYFGMVDLERLLEIHFVPKLKTLMELASTLDDDLKSGADGVIDPVEATRIKQLGCDKFAHLMARKLYRNITGGYIEQDEDLRVDYTVSVIVRKQDNDTDCCYRKYLQRQQHETLCPNTFGMILPTTSFSLRFRQWKSLMFTFRSLMLLERSSPLM